MINYVKIQLTKSQISEGKDMLTHNGSKWLPHKPDDSILQAHSVLFDMERDIDMLVSIRDSHTGPYVSSILAVRGKVVAERNKISFSGTHELTHDGVSYTVDIAV